MKKQSIRTKDNNQVYLQDWDKVERLPFGGLYADKSNGFNDHVDEDGNIYRVYFSTWTTKKNIVKQ